MRRFQLRRRSACWALLARPAPRRQTARPAPLARRSRAPSREGQRLSRLRSAGGASFRQIPQSSCHPFPAGGIGTILLLTNQVKSPARTRRAPIFGRAQLLNFKIAKVDTEGFRFLAKLVCAHTLDAGGVEDRRRESARQCSLKVVGHEVARLGFYSSLSSAMRSMKYSLNPGKQKSKIPFDRS